MVQASSNLSANSNLSAGPWRFALKELIVPELFPLRLGHDIRKYLPELSEAAIQRYMRHSSIVDTYWADVRCLHPTTNAQLPFEVWDIADTDFAADDDAIRGGGACWKGKDPHAQLTSVRLQLRIAMEYCDLGALTGIVSVASLSSCCALQAARRLAVAAACLATCLFEFEGLTLSVPTCTSTSCNQVCVTAQKHRCARAALKLSIDMHSAFTLSFKHWSATTCNVRVDATGTMKDCLDSTTNEQPTCTLQERLAVTYSVSVLPGVSKQRCVLLAMLDIAEALRFMHKSNLLHGDLKPQNVLLVSTPHVRFSKPNVYCVVSLPAAEANPGASVATTCSLKFEQRLSSSSPAASKYRRGRCMWLVCRTTMARASWQNLPTLASRSACLVAHRTCP